MNRFKIVWKRASSLFFKNSIVIRTEKDLMDFTNDFADMWNNNKGIVLFVNEKGVAHYIDTCADILIKIKEVK